MPVRAAVLLALLLSQSTSAPRHADLSADLLKGREPLVLTLTAPLEDLFTRGADDENISVPGTLSFKDPASGSDVVLPNIAVSVRGHTSRRETECTFPKLKLKLKGGGSIKIGTHCGEAPDEVLSAKYGRLANEMSPLREALVYQLLEAAEVPVLRTRPARISYIDTAQNRPLLRNALLLEDDDDAMKRLNGRGELPMETFGSVAMRRASADAGRIAFGEAMIGNFDWCLKFAPGDIYRCNEPKPLWNVLAFDRDDGTASLIMKDFDLAGMVVGRHQWFDKVWNRAFVPSRSEVEIEVLSQVQRTRSLFPRAELDTVRRHFLDRKPAVYAALEKASVDPRGRELARAYLDKFFTAIAEDETFYRPVVAREDVQVYLDPQATQEACRPKDAIRAGTPVNELQRSGRMSQVVILDALWRWASRNECDNVQNGPVWILSDAITMDYPAK
jgi:hypothetical protein